jgi:hypothetical protein
MQPMNSPHVAQGIKKRQDAENLGNAYLDRAVADRRERHGERRISRADDGGVCHSFDFSVLLYHASSLLL